MFINKLIVLCHTQDTEYNYEGSPPLGILSIGAFLETKGYKIEYYDARIHSSAQFKKLIAQNPLVVGFSVMGGFQITTARYLSGYVKKHSAKTTVIWGGFFPTMQPKICFSCLAVDIVIPNEGELLFAKILSALKNNSSLDHIENIYYRKNNTIQQNQFLPPAINLNTMPLAYTGKAIEILQIFQKRGFQRERIGYETSRGCSGNCSYCYSAFFYTAPPRIKSIQKISADLLELKNHGIQEIEIFDDTLLGGNKQKIIAFANIMAELQLSWLANIRLDILDKELLLLLEKAGCTWLFIGIDQCVNLELLKQSKINFVFSIIAGLPQQTDKDIYKLVSHVQKIHRQFPKAEIQIQSFVPLPRTTACQQAIQHGFKLPQTLQEWSQYNHFTVQHPWLRDKFLAAKLYVNSFITYRYHRHFSKILSKFLILSLNFFHIARYFYLATTYVYRIYYSLIRDTDS